MVGGGLWHPDAPSLAKLRASVDERPHRIRRVLTNPAFRKTFLPGAKTGSEKAVVTAFAAANKENALKTKPKVCCCTVFRLGGGQGVGAKMLTWIGIQPRS